MKKEKYRQIYFYPAYLLCIALFVVASLPGSDLTRIQTMPEGGFLRFFLSDPFMHFFTYGLLTGLIYYGNRKSYPDSFPPHLKITILSIGYGIFIEVYQWMLPYRSFGFDDILYNSIGVLTFVSSYITNQIFFLKPRKYS